MARWLMLVLLAMGVGEHPAMGQTPGGAPAYQRRGGGHPGYGPSHAPYPGKYYGRPDYGRRPLPEANVSAGTFQRPYPYHLDYYKQRYGGSYEPYFGNLYGPPNVVLGGVYGGYGAPVYAPPYGYPAAADYPAAPAATQAIVCPHCQQPIYLAAPPDAGE